MTVRYRGARRAATTAGRACSPRRCSTRPAPCGSRSTSIEDITELKRAERGQRFLAEASRVLAGSLDYEETLRAVARLAVPRMADWCAVDLARRATASSASRSPTSTRRGSSSRATLQRALPGRPALRDRASTACCARGAAELYPQITDEMLEQRGPRRGAPGAAALGRPALGDARADAAARPRARRDLVRLRRVGTAVRRAGPRAGGGPRAARRGGGRERAAVRDRELDRRARCRRRCCRRCSPRSRRWRSPPRTARPARGLEVGGDFYDVFSTAEDQWYAVIGDVCGKGAEAAAVTALARYTIRAAAVRRRSPSGDPALAERRDAPAAGRATAASARSPACTWMSAARPSRVTVACGGHPLPLVVRADGATEEIGAPGTLLGLVARSRPAGPLGRAARRRHARPLHRRSHRGGRAGAHLGAGRPGGHGARDGGRPGRHDGRAAGRRGGGLGAARARRRRRARAARARLSPRRRVGLPVAVSSSWSGASSACSRARRLVGGVAAARVGPGRRLLGVTVLGLLGSRQSCARGPRPLRLCDRPSRGPRRAPPWPRPCAPRGRPRASAMGRRRDRRRPS